MDRSIEDLEAIERALPGVARRLIHDAFDEGEPVRPVRRIGQADEGAVAVGVDEQLIVAEDGGDARVIGGGPVDGGIAMGAVCGQFGFLGGEWVRERNYGDCGEKVCGHREEFSGRLQFGSLGINQ